MLRMVKLCLETQLQFRFEMPEMIHATGHARADDHNGIALV